MSPVSPKFNKTAMELLEAVETQSLEQIKALIKSKNLLLHDNSLSHRCLMEAFLYERKDVIKFFLEKHCSVNVAVNAYEFYTTPLHCAVKLRDVDLIKTILKRNPFVIQADSNGNSPLHLAFLYKFEEAVDLILTHIEEKAKYVNAKNNYGLSHMHIACTRKNKNVIKGFLNAKVNLENFVNEDSPSWAGYTAFHFAAEFGSLEALKILQNVKEAEPNTRTTSNSNVKEPWQLVHERLDDQLVMSYLLRDKNHDSNGESQTYFLLACLRKDPSLLKKFFNNGADVKHSLYHLPLNPSWDSALHFAAQNDLQDNLEFLLQKVDTPERKNKFLMTALHIALYKDHLQNNEIVDLLYNAFEINGEINNEDKNGLGYFQIAVTRNDLKVVKEFLDKGADVNKLIEPNTYKFSHYTPLHFAILYQHNEMAKLLIKHGANVDLTGEKNNYGTPLHMAFAIGHKELIEILLRSGANAKLKNANGSTMLHMLLTNFIKEDNLQQNLLHSDKQAILMYIEQLIKLGVAVNAQAKDGHTALYDLRLEEEKCAACFQLLLELGADINLETADNCLPFDSEYYEESRCNSAEYLIFYHHVQKLKTLGLEVHPKNDEICEMIIEDLMKLEPNETGFRNEEFACRQQQRLDEIVKLKNIMITPFMSLYHFLKLEPTRAAAYIPNDVLEEILMQKDFDKTYPSYGYLIRLQYKNNFNGFRAKDLDKRRPSCGIDKECPPSKRQRLE